MYYNQEIMFMPFTSPYDSRSYVLKPVSILLVLGIVLVNLILGSIIAVVLSWAWLAIAATMLIVDALRLRFKSLTVRTPRKAPVTIEGIYSAIDGSSQSKSNG
jgi:hypothetical protein